MNILRVYIDTSVAGGYHEDEFKESMQPLYGLFRNGECKPEISTLVLEELDAGAPARVKESLKALNPNVSPITDEMKKLRDKYMEQAIVSNNFKDDALHIAAATVMGVDVLVSLNFKHIVNLNKMKAFNRVNVQEGYTILEIRTPRGVLDLAQAERELADEDSQSWTVKEETVPYMAGERKVFRCVGFKHDLQDAFWEKTKDMPDAERDKYWGCSTVAYFRALNEMSEEQGWPNDSNAAPKGYTLVRTAAEYIDEVLAEMMTSPRKRFEDDVRKVLTRQIFGKTEEILSK